MWALFRSLELLRPASNHYNATVGVRYASKKGAGYTRNQGKHRTGKRLGQKKVEGEYVKPGHVIMRQRGTKYYSGKNVRISY